MMWTMTTDDLAELRGPAPSAAGQGPERPLVLLPTGPVETKGGAHGRVTYLVLDRHGRGVTYLVVKPRGVFQLSRLVPTSRVCFGDDRLFLDLTQEGLLRCEAVDVVQFLALGQPPQLEDGWDIGIVEEYVWCDSTGGSRPRPPSGGAEMLMRFHRIPAGSAELTRGSEVLDCADHQVGTVHGVVVDEASLVTHLILASGHLHPHRKLALPGQTIGSVHNDLVRLSVPRDQLGSYVMRSPRHG